MDEPRPNRYAAFPPWFFERVDESPDPEFYGVTRLVTHIDDGAITDVGELYRELVLHQGAVLDICSSWVSHFLDRPKHLTVLGMNSEELAANPFADERVVADLNVEPILPFADASFDAVTCCVSVDYLTRPLEVFDQVARVLRPGGSFVCTFSNRCFPTKAVKGWLHSDDQTHCGLVAEFFNLSGWPEPGGWGEPLAQRRNPTRRGDPLFAVWATRDLS